MADVAYIPGEAGRERRPAIGHAMVISAALLFALNGTVSTSSAHSTGMRSP